MPSAISEEEKISQRFVTVQHTFAILKAMNDKCAHTIAKSNEKVIGYALAMDKDFKNHIEVLSPMFKKIDENLPSYVAYIIIG